jgi:hypothetical protein
MTFRYIITYHQSLLQNFWGILQEAHHLIFEFDGAIKNAMPKVSEPQNAPDQQARIFSQGSGPALRLLSVALFRVPDSVHA